jgi:hypothetical protein
MSGRQPQKGVFDAHLARARFALCFAWLLSGVQSACGFIRALAVLLGFLFRQMWQAR